MPCHFRDVIVFSRLLSNSFWLFKFICAVTYKKKKFLTRALDDLTCWLRKKPRQLFQIELTLANLLVGRHSNLQFALMRRINLLNETDNENFGNWRKQKINIIFYFWGMKHRGLRHMTGIMKSLWSRLEYQTAVIFQCNLLRQRYTKIIFCVTFSASD